MNTFESYVTEERILRILAKFHLKYETKCSSANYYLKKIPEENAQLRQIIPTAFHFRHTTRNQKIENLVHYLQKTLPNNFELGKFLTEIKRISRTGDFDFPKPEIIPIPKKNDTYRPICKYDDLTAKTVMTLMAEWFSTIFDSFFHEEMLAYRPRREYHGETKTTTYTDIVPTIEEYREKHRNETICVTECDIRNFFDILHHDIILECFDRLCKMIPGNNFDPTAARKLLSTFLESYSFYNDIYKKNSDDAFWQEKLGARYEPNHIYKFMWPEAALKEKDRQRRGIPQGSALSTIIANIVLSSVDENIVTNKDNNRLFIRYCDDILLMHTSLEECIRLKDVYKTSLERHKLLYHEFEHVAVLEKNSDGYWSAKSKEPYLWETNYGNNPDSARWIGFLGYELSREGEVRLRKATVAKKIERIYSEIRLIQRCEDPALRNIHLLKLNNLRIDIPDGHDKGNLLLTHPGINENSYTDRQIRGLKEYKDRYTVK